MRLRAGLVASSLVLCGRLALAYVPGKTPAGANRHWSSGTIAVQLTGPATIDGHAVHESVRDAMAAWNAVAQARIDLTATGDVEAREPSIGNGKNEFGWVESSDNPYFIPGVPCTTAYIYDTLTGVMDEADTTCNALAYQWPDGLSGLFTQADAIDAASAALAAFGTWLGLDASVQYGDPMCPVTGSGAVRRSLAADQFAFARFQYGDGTSARGSIAGRVRFSSQAPIPYAYVVAAGLAGLQYGAVAGGDGAYSIPEMQAGSYRVAARPLTTDPYVISSEVYRANPIANLDFNPEWFGSGGLVQVADGATTTGIDVTATRTGSQPDLYEPNDSAALASPLTLGYSKLASSHAALDTDWFSFQTAPNVCYEIVTGFHGASIVPTFPVDALWSRTILSLYDGATLIGRNLSIDEAQLHPGNWLTYCETGLARRLDVEVGQREPVGGAGYFYTLFVQEIEGGASLAPVVSAVDPSSGWSTLSRAVWIEGNGLMPGARVEVRLANGTWADASNETVAQCDASYRCQALKAVLPPGAPGPADVRVTNPNGRTVTKVAGYEYIAVADGPVDDVTPQAFGVRYGQGKAVCIGDYDGDGDDDILKTRNGFLPIQLFRNDGDGTFSDTAGPAGLRLTRSTFGRSCSWIDVDDDGDLDAYVTNVAYSLPAGAANELYVNHLADEGSATFTAATPAGLAGVASRYKSDAAWADFDNDGRLDVVLAYDSYAGSPPYPDAVQLFRQNANGSFSDATAASGLGGYVASVTSVLAADFDNDRCEDLVFFSYGGASNRLYKGDCAGHFTDFTSVSHVGSGAPWCAGAALADFNRDGNIDIFCGTYNTGPGPIRPRLWLNNGQGVFTDRAAEAGLHAVLRNMDVILPVDEDNDGLIDVYVGSSERGWPDDRKDVLLRNLGGNPPVFADVTGAAAMFPATQDGTGLCVAGVDEFYCDRDAAAGGVLDWNGDGASDVFVSGDDPDALQRGSDFLWRNGRDANDWIDVALKGANTASSRVLSNRLGIGARVTVVPRFNLPGGAVPTEAECLENPLPAGVTAFEREVIAGNRSQSSTVLHFGLGGTMPFGAKRVDCIRVLWPSGLERAYTGVIANSKAVLAEDVGRMKVVSVVPNSGPNDHSDPTRILGLHFDRDVAAVPRVYFGAVPALAVTFVSDHELSVLPPLWQPPGPVDVTVVNTDGVSDTLVAGYTFTGVEGSLRIKDPVPAMIGLDGVVPDDAEFLAARGTDRTGVIADGVTRLVLETVVAGPGSVRFTLDDDDNPADSPPSPASVGALAPVGGGTAQTSVTVPVRTLGDGRHLAHALYTAPQEFIRNDADRYVGRRSLWLRSVFTDPTGVEHPGPARPFDLVRVPVLYVHGMWGDSGTIAWPLVNDPRWIARRADYAASNAVSFAENEPVPPRLVAEIRKQINDQGIAGTRFVVVAFSMGAVLFKSFMSGAAAPYARADNFFVGDVYALVAIDAPFFGSYFATFVRELQSRRLAGPVFSAAMHTLGMDVDRGCMRSMDPEGVDIPGIPATAGTFHALSGWGGGEMRAAGLGLPLGSRLAGVQEVLRALNVGFEDFLLRCGSGDDFIVCTDSQHGGLSGGKVSDFHFEGPSALAIHFGSICEEAAPGAAAEALLNTPTSDSSVWGHVLPQAPVTARAVAAALPDVAIARETTSANDGISMTASKQSDGVRLDWTGPATRLLKSFSAAFAAGACLTVSGTSLTDAHALTLPASIYYTLGPDSLCTPQSTLAIGSVGPPSGSAMGGYTVTLLGSGFTPQTKVKIGKFYASQVAFVDATTLTFRMPSGDPGSVTVTVIDPSGATATGVFMYVDPGAVPGAVQITAPANGSTVAAGATVSVAAIGTGGFKIAKALVYGRGFTSSEDHDAGDGFATTVTLPADVLGPVTIELLAGDANGNLKSATPVVIDAVVPGNVSLERLDAERLIMLHASPAQRLRVFGIYSDGVRRELSDAAGISYEMDTQDIRKPNYPYNGTGVAVVDATGNVTAKSQGTTICHVSYAGRTIDVVVEVAEVRPTLTVQKPGFISWPYQGAGVTYDLVRGKLSGLRASGGNYADPATALACLKNDFANVTAADASNPPAADGFFYLMRESRTRSYEESPFWSTRSQLGVRTTEIAAAPGLCP